MWIALLWGVIALAIPAYQAAIFNLDIGAVYIINTTVSVFVAAMFYLIAYWFVLLLTNVSSSLYKTNIDDYLDIFQVFLVASFLVFYCEALALPDWSIYEGFFNWYLILVATYYGIAFFRYNREIKPSFAGKPLLNVEREGIKTNLLLFSMLVVVLFGFQWYRVTSLKSGLYTEALNVLNTNSKINIELGSELDFSTIVVGNIENGFGWLRFNVKGNNKNLVVRVEGKAIAGIWTVSRLIVKKPKEQIQII